MKFGECGYADNKDRDLNWKLVRVACSRNASKAILALDAASIFSSWSFHLPIWQRNSRFSLRNNLAEQAPDDEGPVEDLGRLSRVRRRDRLRRLCSIVATARTGQGGFKELCHRGISSSKAAVARSTRPRDPRRECKDIGPTGTAQQLFRFARSPPESMRLPKLNSFELQRYGSVCQMVWEGVAAKHPPISISGGYRSVERQERAHFQPSRPTLVCALDWTASQRYGCSLMPRSTGTA